MAKSTCIKCGKSEFELKIVTPEGSREKLHFIQCISCGGVAGVLESYAIGQLILKLADKMNLPLDQ